jgi:hypothetical protein
MDTESKKKIIPRTRNKFPQLQDILQQNYNILDFVDKMIENNKLQNEKIRNELYYYSQKY